MQTGALPLTLAPGWQQVPPRETGHRLIWQREGRMFVSGTDARAPVPLGVVSPVECPTAVDAARGFAYRYECADWSERRDRSEIRRYDLATGESERFRRLELNQWMVWLLACLPEAGVLVALVASELPLRRDGGVAIQHQLGFFGLPEGPTGEKGAERVGPQVPPGAALFVPLPEDCFYPLDLDPARGRVLFHGATGYQVVDFQGNRQWRMRGVGLPEGRGGAFHPTDPDRVALGGAGVAVVDRHGRALSSRERGMNPVWAPDGEGLFFAESGGDLWHWDASGGRCERLLGVAGDRHAEVNLARPARLSPDGQRLAVPLVRRVRRAVEGDPARSEWTARRVVCVLDLASRQVWQFPGGGPLGWVD